MLGGELGSDPAPVQAARTPAALKGVTGQIVDAAFSVHSRLGPGLLEAVYEACLEHELQKRGLWVQRQVALPLVYDSLHFELAYRLDMLVENCVIVELKSVEAVSAVHKAQLKTYLKLSGHRVGLLVNFNVALIKHGITRVEL